MFSTRTYLDLVNAKANVLVLSDPAGGLETYSTAEIAAVTKYARNGHYISISNLFEKTGSARCLFRKITGSSWQSQGYPNSEAPTNGSWTGNLDHATAVAQSDNYVGVITTYAATGYTAVFISNFPEY